MNGCKSLWIKALERLSKCGGRNKEEEEEEREEEEENEEDEERKHVYRGSYLSKQMLYLIYFTPLFLLSPPLPSPVQEEEEDEEEDEEEREKEEEESDQTWCKQIFDKVRARFGANLVH